MAHAHGSIPRYIETVPRKDYRFIELVTAKLRLGRRFQLVKFRVTIFH
jgi:hypothetical protein